MNAKDCSRKCLDVTQSGRCHDCSFKGPWTPGAPRPKRGYAVELRLRLIDFLLAQYGYVNRSALVDYFGISMPQASLDFRAYVAIAPHNMRYDVSEKCHRVTERFKRVWA